MSQRPFTISDAGEIALAPFMYREVLRDDVRRRHHEADANRSRGVRFGGMEPGTFRDRTEAERRASAQAAYEQAKAYGESPRGRLGTALRQLELAGHGAAADAARSAMCRGFLDTRQPASLSEIGAALKALQTIEGDTASAVLLAEACQALAEILGERGVRKAA